MKIEPPYGLILTGGQSSRMGSDKSLLDIKGKPHREYLFSILSAICPKVYTSCRSDQDVPASLNPLVDQYAFAGPINGILSAFHTKPQVPWLIIAVDMPFIDESSLRFLIDHRDPDMMATCFIHQPQQFPEPLLTIWEPKAGPALLAFAKAGNRSPRVFLERERVRMLRPPNDQLLRNVNYPRDLDTLK